MKANPSKFQSIVFKTLRKENDIELRLCNETINNVPCVKLLGVMIDDKMCFDEHVSKLCIQAARQTNALRRISKYISDECRLSIYSACIASNFIYCNTVWHFCSKRSTYKMERVHKKALRVALNDYESSYSVLLNKVCRAMSSCRPNLNKTRGP